MRRFVSSGGALLLCCHLASAAISNWTFDTPGIYFPTDSLSYSCASDADTITTRIYLETGDATSGLDTNLDILLFTITMIDNHSGESWKENRGILDDVDPIKGKFCFNPGSPGLAPGIYRMLVTDGTGSITRLFRISDFPQPYRVITGTVRAPAGISLAWNSVTLSGGAGVSTLSGWTDATGAYRIAIDRATVEMCGNKMTAYVESRYGGFITSPAQFTLDFTTNNWNEVNFSFVSAPAVVRGAVLSVNGPVPNIRVALSDSMHTIIAQSISGPDGAYTISCPLGLYLISAENPDNGRPVKLSQTKLLISNSDTIIHDLSLSIEDIVAALPAEQDLRGNGVLKLMVIDSTLAMVDKGVIMVWDGRPGNETTARPLRIFPLQKLGANLTLVDIPDRKCCLSVELSGSVLGSDCRYSVFATDSRGKRRMFDYATNDTFQCAIILHEKDRVHSGWGGGTVQGMVVTDLQHKETRIAVLLYDIDRASVVRGCTIDGEGSFWIGNIPTGAYRLAAAIDTNNDKSPDVTAMADTTLIFTGNESFADVNVAFSEKPAGAFRIAGQLTGIGVIPENVVLTVAALPVDSMAPFARRLDVAAFMAAYRAQVQSGGTFAIDNLPPGAYYVVAAAEKKDSASEITRDLAFGIYGDMLVDNFANTPVIPRAVVIGDEIVLRPIVISLIMQSRNDGVPLITGSKLRIPGSFALQSAHIDGTGTVRIEFAVPQRTAVVFSVDNMSGRAVAAMPEAIFAPGFHMITINVDQHTAAATAPLFVSMKSASFRTRQAITPHTSLLSEASSAIVPAVVERHGGGSM